VGLAVEACEQLSQQGKKIRVVSMPCTDVFDAQDEAYKESVLPTGVTARVAVEAGVSDFWIKYVGLQGKVVGIDRFGESAPAGDAMKYFGFTADNVAKIMQAAMV
jgi:transketolase